MIEFIALDKKYRLLRHDKLNLKLEVYNTYVSTTRKPIGKWSLIGYYNPLGLERALYEIVSQPDSDRFDIIGWGLSEYYKAIHAELRSISTQIAKSL